MKKRNRKLMATLLAASLTVSGTTNAYSLPAHAEEHEDTKTETPADVVNAGAGEKEQVTSTPELTATPVVEKIESGQVPGDPAATDSVATEAPSPSVVPTVAPTAEPTAIPTAVPTVAPTQQPIPTELVTASPSQTQVPTDGTYTNQVVYSDTMFQYSMDYDEIVAGGKVTYQSKKITIVGFSTFEKTPAISINSTSIFTEAKEQLCKKVYEKAGQRVDLGEMPSITMDSSLTIGTLTISANAKDEVALCLPHATVVDIKTDWNVMQEFNGCSKLQTVTFEGNTVFAAENSFQNCSKLTNLTFAKAVDFNKHGLGITARVSMVISGELSNMKSEMKFDVLELAGGVKINTFLQKIDANQLILKADSKKLYYNTDSFRDCTFGSVTMNGNVILNASSIVNCTVGTANFNGNVTINANSICGGSMKTVYFNGSNKLEGSSFYNCEVKNFYFCNPTYCFPLQNPYIRDDGKENTVFHIFGGSWQQADNKRVSSYEVVTGWDLKKCTIDAGSVSLNSKYKINLQGKKTASVDFSSLLAPTLSINSDLASSNGMSTTKQLTMTLFGTAASTNDKYRVYEEVATSGTSSEYQCSYTSSEGKNYSSMKSSVKELTVGSYVFFVEAGGMFQPITVEVEDHTVASISATLNEGVVKYEGDTITKKDITVFARYADGESGAISDYSFSGDTKVKAGQNTFIVVSGNAQTELNVQAANNAVVSYKANIPNVTKVFVGQAISIDDVVFSDVKYNNPNMKYNANSAISEAQKPQFLINGTPAGAYEIQPGTNKISISYLGCIMTDVLVIEGVENDVKKIEATYVGVDVFVGQEISTDAKSLSVVIYKALDPNNPDSLTATTLKDNVGVSLDKYTIVEGENQISVRYNGKLAESKIVVRGKKDSLLSIEKVNYNGSTIAGTKLDAANFQIEAKMLSGKILKSSDGDIEAKNLTVAPNVLVLGENYIEVGYQGKAYVLKIVGISSEVDSSVVEDPTSTSDTTKPVVTVGKKYTIGNVKYKIIAMTENSGSVEIIGYNKKAKNIKLKSSIKIEGHTYYVTRISGKAFMNCSTLKGKLVFGDKVKTIGASAFAGCKNITMITIGKNTSKIGAKAFYGCSKLKTLDFTKSQKLTSVGAKAFLKISSKKNLALTRKNVLKYYKLLKGKY